MEYQNDKLYLEECLKILDDIKAFLKEKFDEAPASEGSNPPSKTRGAIAHMININESAIKIIGG